MNRRTRTRTQYAAAASLVAVAIAGVALFLAGSGSSTQPAVPTKATATRHVAEAAGPNPSASAQMVCAPEAQREVATALGSTGTVPVAPTWADHLYSCQYVYPTGVISVSVKELSSHAETGAYFASLHAQLGESQH